MTEVTINGEDRQLAAGSLLAALRELEIDPLRKGVAVALNGRFVPRSNWPDVVLSRGDRLEIVRPVAGG